MFVSQARMLILDVPSHGLEVDWAKLFAISKKGERFPRAHRCTVRDPPAHGYNGLLAVCFGPNLIINNIHIVFNAKLEKLEFSSRHEFNGGEPRGWDLGDGSILTYKH